MLGTLQDTGYIDVGFVPGLRPTLTSMFGRRPQQVADDVTASESPSARSDRGTNSSNQPGWWSRPAAATTHYPDWPRVVGIGSTRAAAIWSFKGPSLYIYI